MVSVEFDIGQSPHLIKFLSQNFPRGENLRVIGFGLLVYAIAHLTVLAVYRLFFHPLSQYPGPWLGAATGLYYHGHMLIGDVHEHTLKLHDKYGPVVRVGPNHVLYIDSVAWKDIFGHRTKGKSATKRVNMAAHYPGHESVIAAVSEENHSRQRRIFSHAFSEQALRKQEPMFQKYVDLLINNLKGQLASTPDKKFNIVDYYNFTTFDVMGDLTFSEPLGMLQNSEYSPWVKKIFQAVKFGVVSYVMRQYTVANWFMKKFVLSKLAQDRRTHLSFSESRVDRRLENDTEKPDIWKLVLDQKGERVLTRMEMYANASLFMIAGTETTATLLSGMTYYLLKTPQTLKKLRAELDTAFPNGEGITSEKLEQLKYLNACIEEGLRVYPPVPSAPRRVAPKEGAVIAGGFVPADTHLGITQYAAYHSERNFGLPHEFHPERWLDGAQEDPRFKNDNKAAMQPFSYGPRACLGRNMAWFEMRLIAARVLLNFDLELMPESNNWHKQKVYGLWEKNPLMVRLKVRE